ncbi:hypothetical protein Tco_1512720, partial [Tanacetum coccineum]
MLKILNIDLGDGKTILLNLHESDDDADVENGCDDTATPS